MLNITQRLPAITAHAIDDYLVLPFDLRQKSRLRVTLKSGIEAALMLDRGTILRGGDLLKAEDGKIVQIVAAEQPVTDVKAETQQALMCTAYHLGNGMYLCK